MNTYYLEMLASQDAVLTPMPEDARIDPVIQQAHINQQFYRDVGQQWAWKDKAGWPIERWQAYVNGFGDADHLPSAPIERIETAILRWQDKAAGYFELSQVASDVEIRYFGLLPHAIGQGLGGALLSAAIEQGWQMGAQRLWVHTCDLDHPAALPNYQRRGFKLYQTTTE